MEFYMIIFPSLLFNQAFAALLTPENHEIGQKGINIAVF